MIFIEICLSYSPITGTLTRQRVTRWFLAQDVSIKLKICLSYTLTVVLDAASEAILVAKMVSGIPGQRCECELMANLA